MSVKLPLQSIFSQYAKKDASAMSSVEATEKVLACAGLEPEPGVGLGDVLTAERIDKLLPHRAMP